MAGQTKAPGGDALDFREDGTVYIRWDDQEATLRRPKVKEWGSFLEEMEACDTWLGEQKGASAAKLAASDSPYRGLYARILQELGGLLAERGDLPLWMSDGKLVARLNQHWLALPLPPSA